MDALRTIGRSVARLGRHDIHFYVAHPNTARNISSIIVELRSVQLPNAPPSSFLPVVHQEPNSFERSRISIPSCHVCLWEYENKGTSPYWKMEWTLALVLRCPKHLVLLSECCDHCFLGGLALVAHPKHGGLVARCTVCFRAVTSNSSSDPAVMRYRTPLVASLGQALASSYHGLDPDPIVARPA